LGLDDETYRAMLASIVPGKSSCRDMSPPELQKVIKAMEARGFKVKPASRPRQMSKPSAVSENPRSLEYDVC
jgi:phage gp16-like protein